MFKNRDAGNQIKVLVKCHLGEIASNEREIWMVKEIFAQIDTGNFEPQRGQLEGN